MELVEHLALHFLPREARLGTQVDALVRQAAADDRAALVELQFLSARDGDAQAERDVVREMVATDGEAAGEDDLAAHVGDVFGGARAEVEHERAEPALLVGEHRGGRGEAGEDAFLAFEAGFLHGAHAVLDARRGAVDDVAVGLDRAAVHAGRGR